MAPPSPRQHSCARLPFESVAHDLSDGGVASEEMIENVRSLMFGQLRMESILQQLLQASGADGIAPKPLPASHSPSEATASTAHKVEKMDAACQVDNNFEETVELPANFSVVPVPPVIKDRFDPLASVGKSHPMHKRSSTSDSISLPSWYQNLRMRKELKGSMEELSEELTRNTLRRANPAKHSSCQITVNGSAVSGRSHRLPVLTPSSKRRLCLDMMSLLVLAYDTTSVPYLVAFENDDAIFVWLSFASVAYWVIDMLVNFRTGYYVKGELEMRPMMIARNYIKGAFCIDILVIFVDVLAVLLKTVEQNTSESDSIKLMRIFKLSRLVRLIGNVRLRKLRVTLEGQTGRHVSAVLPTVFFLLETGAFVVVFIWLNHLIACLWCFIGRDLTSDTGLSWLDQTTGDRPYSSYGYGYQYSTALHWAITQMTPGSMQVFPQNTKERVFNIICLVAGLVVFSTLISAISARVTNFRILMQSHRTKMDRLATFLERSKVSSDLRTSVCIQADLRLQEIRPSTVKDLDFLNKLSLSLRSELQFELCEPYLLEHPYLIFLSEADHALWKDVCQTCVDFSMLIQKDTLFSHDTQATAMYFVTLGSISYTVDVAFRDCHDDRIGPDEVRWGQSLSEAALWCQWQHVGCAEVLVARNCEVLSLQADRLLHTLGKHPLVAQVTWAYGQSFYINMMNSQPPVCSPPNDLHLPFGVDETLASMPRDATICCSKVALRFLRQSRWIQYVREDKTDQLIREVKQGSSTLLATRKRGAVRCVPMVVLKLTRTDGKVFVRLRLIKKADGSEEATCRHPGGKQYAGEHPSDCLQRLLQEKLRPLAEGLVIGEVEKKSEMENSPQFGVPTRYIRTVISADWEDQSDAALQELLVEDSQRKMPARNATLATKSTGTTGSKWVWVEAEVFSFPDGDIYAWLTQDEFNYLSSPRGQRALSDWLSVLDAGPAPEAPPWASAGC